MFAASQGGGSNNAGAFATALWSGNGTARSIITNVNTSTYGGLVWVKNRSIASDHLLMDTERGNTVAFVTRRNNGSGVTYLGPEVSGYDTKFTSFDANGFSIGAGSEFNASGNTFVSWNFRKQTGFFDIVKWTGNGASSQTIQHNLGAGSTPGFMIIAARSSDYKPIFAWHRSLPSEAIIRFSQNTDAGVLSTYKITAVDDTSFTVSPLFNDNGVGFIAYLWGHDTSSIGFVNCGTYTGNGSSSGPAVSLGWNPQFLIIKNISRDGATSTPSEWVMMDAARGMTTGSDAVLFESTAVASSSNLAPAETSVDYVDPSGNGFSVKSTSTNVNGNGDNYIYMAIR